MIINYVVHLQTVNYVMLMEINAKNVTQIISYLMIKQQMNLSVLINAQPKCIKTNPIL